MVNKSASSKDFERTNRSNLRETESGTQEGKLLIDYNDPLIVPCIDENEFIRNLGGSMMSERRNSSYLSEIEDDTI